MVEIKILDITLERTRKEKVGRLLFGGHSASVMSVPDHYPSADVYRDRYVKRYRNSKGFVFFFCLEGCRNEGREME